METAGPVRRLRPSLLSIAIAVLLLAAFLRDAGDAPGRIRRWCCGAFPGAPGNSRMRRDAMRARRDPLWRVPHRGHSPVLRPKDGDRPISWRITFVPRPEPSGWTAYGA